MTVSSSARLLLGLAGHKLFNKLVRWSKDLSGAVPSTHTHTIL